MWAQQSGFPKRLDCMYHAHAETKPSLRFWIYIESAHYFAKNVGTPELAPEMFLASFLQSARMHAKRAETKAVEGSFSQSTMCATTTTELSL